MLKYAYEIYLPRLEILHQHSDNLIKKYHTLFTFFLDFTNIKVTLDVNRTAEIPKLSPSIEQNINN